MSHHAPKLFFLSKESVSWITSHKASQYVKQITVLEVRNLEFCPWGLFPSSSKTHKPFSLCFQLQCPEKLQTHPAPSFTDGDIIVSLSKYKLTTNIYTLNMPGLGE